MVRAARAEGGGGTRCTGGGRRRYTLHGRRAAAVHAALTEGGAPAGLSAGRAVVADRRWRPIFYQRSLSGLCRRVAELRLLPASRAPGCAGEAELRLLPAEAHGAGGRLAVAPAGEWAAAESVPAAVTHDDRLHGSILEMHVSMP